MSISAGYLCTFLSILAAISCSHQFKGNHTFLGSNSSSSFVQSNQNFNVTYGSGAVAGVICQDNVNIAGLQLNNHTFGVANEETVQFSADTVAFDGLMGLAQSVSQLVDIEAPTH